MAVYAAFVGVMMWSSARPDVLSHRVMYGFVGCNRGTSDEYVGVVFVRKCITRCFGTGTGSVPRVCVVFAGDCAWKSPRNVKDVSGKRFDIVAMAFLMAGMQLDLLVCCTSYMFISVMCALVVLRVMQ